MRYFNSPFPPKYMTSKCHSIRDLCNNLTHFGFRGEALASIREVSGMLTLESRPLGSNTTYIKGFAHGKAQKAVVSKNDRAGHGTTITVLDFMYNVPVRRQRFKSAIDLEEIKSSIESIALIHPQFVYVNKRLVLKSKFHKLANSMFGNSALLRTTNTSHDNPISKELTTSYWLAFPPPRREKHAVYMFNIECPFHAYDVCLDPKKTLIEFCDWDTVLQCLESVIRNFLQSEFSSSSKSESQASNTEIPQKMSLLEEVEHLQHEISDLKSGFPRKSGLKAKTRTANQLGSATTRNMLDVSRIIKGDPVKRKNTAEVINENQCMDDNLEMELQIENMDIDDDNTLVYVPEPDVEPRNVTFKDTTMVLDLVSESDKQTKLDKCELENPYPSLNSQNTSQRDIESENVGITVNKMKNISPHSLAYSSEIPISDSDFDKKEICKYTKNCLVENVSVEKGFHPIVNFRNMINERNKPLSWQLHRKHIPPIVKFREEVKLLNVDVHVEEKKTVMPLKLFEQNTVIKNENDHKEQNRHVNKAVDRRSKSNVIVKTKDIMVSGYVRAYPNLHKLKQLRRNSNMNALLVEKFKEKDKMSKVMEPLRVHDLVGRFAKKEIDRKTSRQPALNVFQHNRKSNDSVVGGLFKKNANNTVNNCYSDFDKMGNKNLSISSKTKVPIRKYCSSSDFVHSLEKEKKQKEMSLAKTAYLINTDEIYEQVKKPLKLSGKEKVHYLECNESLELCLENRTKCDMLMNLIEIGNMQKPLCPKSPLSSFNFSPKIMTKNVEGCKNMSIDVSDKIDEERTHLEPSEFVYDIHDKNMYEKESLVAATSRNHLLIERQSNFILNSKPNTDPKSNDKGKNSLIPVYNADSTLQKSDIHDVSHSEFDHKSKSSYETIRRKMYTGKNFENVEINSQNSTFTINLSSTEKNSKTDNYDIIFSNKFEHKTYTPSVYTVVPNSDIDSAKDKTRTSRIIIPSSETESQETDCNADFRKIICESTTDLSSQNSSSISIISDSVSEISIPRCNRVNTNSVRYSIKMRSNCSIEEASNFTISLQSPVSETGKKAFSLQEHISSEENNIIQEPQSSQKTVSSEFIDMMGNMELLSQGLDVIGTSQQSVGNVDVPISLDKQICDLNVEKFNCNNQNYASKGSQVQHLDKYTEIEILQLKSKGSRINRNLPVLLEKENSHVDINIETKFIENQQILQKSSPENDRDVQNNSSENMEVETEMENISIDEELINGQGCISPSPMQYRSCIASSMDSNAEMEVVLGNEIRESQNMLESSSGNLESIKKNISNKDEENICLESSQNTLIDFVVVEIDKSNPVSVSSGANRKHPLPVQYISHKDNIHQSLFTELSVSGMDSQNDMFEDVSGSKNVRTILDCVETYTSDMHEHLNNNDSGRKRKSDVDCQNLYGKVAFSDNSIADMSKIDNVHVEERNTMFTSKSISTQELNLAFDDVMNKYVTAEHEINDSSYVEIEKIDSVNIENKTEKPIGDSEGQFNVEIGRETSKNSSCLEGWEKRVDVDNEFYVHKESGAVSFAKPRKPAAQNIYSMRERFEFLPKGFSPIVKDDVKKNNEETKKILTPITHEALKTMVSESRTDVDDLATIKWKEEENSKRAESDRRMQYCEKNVKNVGVQEIPKNVVRVYNILCPYTFKKDIFSNVKILGQLDKKFIVTKLGLAAGNKQELIVVFDQHAVHERIRVESLMKDYHVEGSDTVFKSSAVDPHIRLKLSDKEARIMSCYEKEFERLGLAFQLLEDSEIEITSVPTCLVQGRGVSVLQGFLESMIREQVETIIGTRGVGITVPSVIQSVVNSEACRGSVKFGDQLSLEECQKLLNDLPKCQLPFQCAHGRPSLVPLADLKHLHLFVPQVQHKPRLWKLRARLKTSPELF
ncbi:hypothetical protein C0J52_21889 [Blattella germanica]|nr:hypothetical protein C0J52_21889 [Blattella germanica]